MLGSIFVGTIRPFTAHDFLRSHFLFIVCHDHLSLRLLLDSDSVCRCLRSLLPRTCPLCRKTFNIDRIKKLHITKPSDEPGGSVVPVDSQSTVLLERVALVSGEDAPDEDIAVVLGDVADWVTTQDNGLSSVSHSTSYCIVSGHCIVEVRNKSAVVGCDRRAVCCALRMILAHSPLRVETAH